MHKKDLSSDGGTLNGYSSSEAQAYATANHTHWCCTSCPVQVGIAPPANFVDLRN